MKLQKLGGYSSIVLVIISLAAGQIAHSSFPGFTGSDYHEPAKMIAAFQASPAGFYSWYAIGILKAFLMLLIVLALNEWMKADVPHLMRLSIIFTSAFSALYIATMMSSIFRNALLTASNDMSAYRSLLIVDDSLGSSAELLLGSGFLLIGWAALRTKRLPQILGYLIIIGGISSIILFTFVVSGSRTGRIVCGLVPLISILWIGVVLLRNKTGPYRI